MRRGDEGYSHKRMTKTIGWSARLKKMKAIYGEGRGAVSLDNEQPVIPILPDKVNA